MKSLKLTIISLAALVIISSCNKEFNLDVANKNAPVSGVSPALILPNIEYSMFVHPFDYEEKAGQFTIINYTYYGDNQYWTGSANLDYTTLNNVVAMENEANKLAPALAKPYLALAKFFRAYFFVNMSLKVGDIPMSQALQGLKNPTPVYDSQKQIFINSLNLLDTANTMINDMLSVNAITSGTYTIAGSYDTYYNGDLKQWQKAINTYALRVLISLSKKNITDPDMGIAAKFAKIYNNPSVYPIMTSPADNLQHVYDGVFSIYPNSPNNYGNDATRDNMAATYLNLLSSLNDIRAQIVAEPARPLKIDTVSIKPLKIDTSRLYADTDYRSFVGGASGQSLSALAQLVQKQAISLIGRHRYYETLKGEPTFILSYQEMCFNIAEAMNLGWVNGTPEIWYKTGIKTDMDFYGVAEGVNVLTFQKQYFDKLYNDTIEFKHFYFDPYYNQTSVKYSSDKITALKQILTQKYLAFARNSGLEAYYQWRRTGVPAFDIGPGNTVNGKIPLRFQYPVNERTANAKNYNAAVQSQYGGSDDVYQTMWILK